MSTPGSGGSSHRTPLGERLREARERRNLSLHTVAERTKIPAANLDALEQDQVGRLPGGIFARSFVRAYAREVGLDAEEAVREFVRTHPEHAPPDAREEAEPTPADRSSLLVRALGLAATVAILGAAGWAGFWWLQGSVPSFRSEEATPAPASPSPAPPSEPPQAPAAPGSELGAVEAEPVLPASGTEPGGATDTPTLEPPPAIPAGGIRLEIHPNAPCWVRVTAGGRVRLERLVQPGERPVVLATDAIELQVGDAGAFDYTVNGRRGRSLGAPGSVVRATISSDTLASFIAR